MRIATYNLLNGSLEHTTELAHFATQQAIGFLGLQGAKWDLGTRGEFENFSGLTAIQDSVDGSNLSIQGTNTSKIDVANFSSWPVLSSETHYEGFLHGAIHTVVPYGDEQLNIWNVHLNPHAEKRRLREIEIVTARISSQEHTIILGNFNSQWNSQPKNDPEYYDDPEHYGVIDYMADHNFIDTAVHVARRANYLEQHPTRSTTPTANYATSNKGKSRRFDYIFASTSMFNRVAGVSVPVTDLTKSISDHYPVILTIDEPQ